MAEIEKLNLDELKTFVKSCNEEQAKLENNYKLVQEYLDKNQDILKEHQAYSKIQIEKDKALKRIGELSI